MAFAPSSSDLVGIASGAALIVLALGVALGRPRSAATVSLALLAGLWGVAIACANAANAMDDAPAIEALLFGQLASYLALLAPAIILVASFPTPMPARRALVAVALVLTAFVLLLLAAAPDLFLRGVVAGPAGVDVERGPLYRITVRTSNVIVPALLLAALILRHRRSSAASADSLALASAALGAYVAHQAGVSAAAAALAPPTLVSPPFLDAFATWAALVVPLGATAIAALVAWRAPGVDRRNLHLALAGIALATGLVEPVLAEAGVVELRSAGLWRIVTVGLLGYAIVRHRMFDLEVRLAALAPGAAYLLAFAGLALLAWIVAGNAATRAPWLGLTLVVGAALAAVPAASAGRRGVDRLAPHLVDPDYLYKRKVDVYRAALEDVRARSSSERTEELFLSDLRRSLGITEQEHRLLLLIVESHARYSRSPTRLQGFDIEREIGRGSFGQAFLARDLSLGRRVVLKRPLGLSELDPRGRERFEREAQVAAKLSHPNVVTIHGLVYDEGAPTLVLEHVEGGSLEDLLRREPKVPPERARRIVQDVLQGLVAIHAAGIVHRDLKPANVLLGADGVAKITDFGIALQGSGLVDTLSASGDQPGSVAYMSPEQARGEPVDPRSDLYSAGVLLYLLLTGEHYLDLRGATPAHARELIANAPPRLPREDVPPSLEPILRRALAKAATDRFASAEEMLRALG